MQPLASIPHPWQLPSPPEPVVQLPLYAPTPFPPFEEDDWDHHGDVDEGVGDDMFYDNWDDEDWDDTDE